MVLERLFRKIAWIAKRVVSVVDQRKNEVLYERYLTGKQNKVLGQGAVDHLKECLIDG
jgi:hypothetical protein